MKIESMVLGELATNFYLLINEHTNEAILVDPGDQPNMILKKIENEGLDPKAIFLTHGHADHIMAVNTIKERLHLPVYASRVEEAVLSDPNMNLSYEVFGESVTVKADVLLDDNQEISVAGMDFRVLLTPGHTIGGCCYYCEKEKVLISGDTLFQASVGRTDFPGGSLADLLRSIEEKLMPLPDDTDVYPGHGDVTTIGDERAQNPFVRNRRK